MTRRGAVRSGPVIVLGGAAVQAEAVLAAHALGREAHVVAAQCGHAARESADAVVQLDLTDVDAVTRYAEQVGASAVCSVGSDLAMPVVAEVSERLGLHSPASLPTTQLCHEKHLVRERLRDAPGSVRHALVSRTTDLPAALAPPVVVKPDDGQGQRGLTLVTSAAQLEPALAHALSSSRTGTVLVEEHVPGPELSVNGYLRDGELVFVGVSDRVVWPEEFGLVRAHTFPSLAGERDVVEAVGVLDAACRAIGLREGPVYAQMILGPTGVRLVEVSPRLDGCHLWRLWRAVTGHDLLTTTIAAACGEADGLPPSRAIRPVAPVRPRVDEPVTTLEFECLPPGTTVIPDDAWPVASRDASILARARYYAPGTVVRTVNGRLEKVAWTLRRETPGSVLEQVGALGANAR
ncbi:ATP-grasp domain-containing protein [Ornithinimicrobium sp. F0845]|uniref:ATP-grasp domain-containing protein n=1 Tax=Ornithinimicrobium sp. F0845 TaxID=2926412 RepID=UPI001FF436D7|nr:ATP-grasp domain-containing protein [Ornithinimicrobium sp. F0845]MCK0112769.1 ATP-grasp domain-containing protein [Ornithinimicrobium sp. F0845]